MKIEMVFWFFIEVLAFILAGYWIALNSWLYVAASVSVAMLSALIIGKEIEKEAIKEYKEKNE